MEASKKTSIFIAYSRKDESFLRELRVFLHPLEQNKQVEIWYDGEIVGGEVTVMVVGSELLSKHKPPVLTTARYS